MSNSKKENVQLYFEIFILMTVLLGIICKWMHVVPFGVNTFATKDGDIQYLDFFAYLKDVLSGVQSVQYTFGKTLGGNNIAVFGYYLASPFNLLLLFFTKSQLEIFFTVIVCLKLSLAAVTCSIFLRKRYGNLDKQWIVVLSLSYGFMQYNIAQICNPMWLDGVYMLPLILLAVHRLVTQKKTIFLMIAVGLSIVFNWYTGAINCLFSVIWFVYEVLLVTALKKENLKKILLHIWEYFYAMLTGVLLSCALFVPVVFAMMGGRAGIDFASLGDRYYWGNCLSFVQKFVIGANSEYANVSLYCGSIPLMGTIAYFVAKLQKKRKKQINAALLGGTISLFYVPVLILLFGLLKDVSSYWYRYSYIGVITLIIICADFQTEEIEKEEKKKALYKSAMIFTLLILTLEYVHPINEMKRVYFTVTAFVLIMFMCVKLLMSETKRKQLGFSVLLICLVSGELLVNTKVMNCIVDHADDYEIYVTEEEKLINELKAYDNDFYRINQTSTRNEESNNLTANYNEAIAFGYNSISGYTSDPDDFQRDFLNCLGYNICGDNMNIVNTSIIGADSLLNVKYVLADYEINGLEKVDEVGTYNGKSVYYNPYVLPFAFTYLESDMQISEQENNPFIYQNQVYSRLLGRNVEIYKKVDYERIDGDNNVSFLLTLPTEEAAVYGYCDFSQWGDGNIYVNDEYICGYSQWLAPRVIYIPCSLNMDNAVVRIDKENASTCILNSQFFYLDLKELENVVDEISKKKINDINMCDGNVVCTIEHAEKNEKLYLSIPYEDGWEILVNGQEIEPELIGNCILTVPLRKGKNVVEMEYHARGVRLGVTLTMVGILILLGVLLRKKHSVCD